MPYLFTNQKWDSEFFKFEVAEILGNGDLEEIKLLIHELKHQGYSLAYWKIASNDILANEVASEMNLFLADTKTFFISDLNTIQNGLNSKFQIEKYQKLVHGDLLSLALQSGEYSRFKTDPRFAEGTFERLYSAWIFKAIENMKTKEIYVSKDGEKLTGFVSINEINAVRSNIDQIAVDKNYRTKNIGKELIQIAKIWSLENKYFELQVATQKKNRIACDFYLACGFKKMKEVNIFHIWL